MRMELRHTSETLKFPNAVVLNAVVRRNTQMSAKERKRKFAKERKRANAGALTITKKSHF